jgi:hypothetical protein
MRTFLFIFALAWQLYNCYGKPAVKIEAFGNPPQVKSDFNSSITLRQIRNFFRDSDLYLFGNSLSRGMYAALHNIFSANVAQLDWSLVDFSRNTQHDRAREKQNCEGYDSAKQNGSLLIKKFQSGKFACSENFEFNNSDTRMTSLYFQNLWTKDLPIFSSLLRDEIAVNRGPTKKYIIFNAGLDDIINKVHGVGPMQPCLNNTNIMSELASRTLNYVELYSNLMSWANGLAADASVTIRATTPVCNRGGGNVCWGKNCTEMNHLIKIQNDMLFSNYLKLAVPGIHYLDAWKTLKGTCSVGNATAVFHHQHEHVQSCDSPSTYIYCGSELCDELYDDWAHSSRLAYHMLHGWLVHLGGDHVRHQRHLRSSVQS